MRGVDAGGQMRRILVTGAASGIGAAVCRLMASDGSAFLVHTRGNRAGAEAVADETRKKGARAEVVLGDLTDPATPGRLVDQAIRHFGGLDVLIANAGFADRTPIADLSDAGMQASVDVIQTGFLRLARASLPWIRDAEHGRIVAVSSFVAHAFRTDLATFPASAAAKAGLEALVRALAIDMGPTGVTVNTVVPGFIEKDLAHTERSIPRSSRPSQRAFRWAASAGRRRSRPSSRSLHRPPLPTSPDRRCTSMAGW